MKMKPRATIIEQLKAVPGLKINGSGNILHLWADNSEWWVSVDIRLQQVKGRYDGRPFTITPIFQNMQVSCEPIAQLVDFFFEDIGIVCGVIPTTDQRASPEAPVKQTRIRRMAEGLLALHP